MSAPYPGLTREQVYAIPDEPGFWGKVEPIGGASEAVHRFMEAVIDGLNKGAENK